MADPTTHALITPMRIDRLTTWCGRAPADIPGDDVATRPSAVTCTACAQAMRIALRDLAEWVPGLPGLPEVGRE